METTPLLPKFFAFILLPLLWDWLNEMSIWHSNSSISRCVSNNSHHLKMLFTILPQNPSCVGYVVFFPFLVCCLIPLDPWINSDSRTEILYWGGFRGFCCRIWAYRRGKNAKRSKLNGIWRVLICVFAFRAVVVGRGVEWLRQFFELFVDRKQGLLRSAIEYYKI